MESYWAWERVSVGGTALAAREFSSMYNKNLKTLQYPFSLSRNPHVHREHGKTVVVINIILFLCSKIH